MDYYEASENLKQNENLELREKIKIFEELFSRQQEKEILEASDAELIVPKVIEEEEIPLDEDTLELECEIKQPVINKYPTWDELNDALKKLKDEKTISECREVMSEKSVKEKEERKTHKSTHNRVYDDLHNELKEVFHKSQLWDDTKVFPQELFVKNFDELQVLRQFRTNILKQQQHFAMLAVNAQNMHANTITDNTLHINKSVKPKRKSLLFWK